MTICQRPSTADMILLDKCWDLKKHHVRSPLHAPLGFDTLRTNKSCVQTGGSLPGHAPAVTAVTNGTQNGSDDLQLGASHQEVKLHTPVPHTLWAGAADLIAFG